MENGEDSSTYYGSITHKNTSIDLEFVVRPRFKVVVKLEMALLIERYGEEKMPTLIPRALKESFLLMMLTLSLWSWGNSSIVGGLFIHLPARIAAHLSQLITAPEALQKVSRWIPAC